MPSAARLPQVMVIADKTPNVTSQSALPSVFSGMAMTTKRRIRPSIPIALLAVAKIAETGLDAPA